MAGISNEDISKVREASDIVEVFSADMPLRQKGRTFWCCCPFHEEATPSCQIDPDAQMFYCFGCHKGGDVFTYVMEREDIDFPDAVRKLADRAGIEIQESGGTATSRSYKTRLREVCAETQAFYHTQLMRLKGPDADAARTYLANRGFGGQVPKAWQLGFAPGHRQLIKHLKEAGFTQKEMLDANVATAYEGKRPNDRFFGRIMFPIFDEGGACIAFGGRVIGEGEPKYLNSQDTPLFKKSHVLYGLDKAKAAMTASGTALVVEGYTDVIALHEAGVKYAVATLGTALTRQHIRLLSRHASKRIIYLFDGDEAGQRAADRALGFIGESMTPEAGKRRIDLLACTLPDNLDPADFVAQHGVEALQTELEKAKPLISYGIDRCIARFDTTSPEGRAAAFSEALQILAPIKDSVLASDYAVQIAGKLHMRENEAIDRLSKLQVRTRNFDESKTVPSSENVAPIDPDKPAYELSRTERNRRNFEMGFLGLLARNPQVALLHAESLAQVAWHVPLHAHICEMLLDIIAQNPQVAASEIIGRITKEHPLSARLFADVASDEENPMLYAQFLADELAIGDMEEAIDTYRARMADPSAISQEEYDLLFSTVASLQRDLIERRSAHNASATR